MMDVRKLQQFVHSDRLAMHRCTKPCMLTLAICIHWHRGQWMNSGLQQTGRAPRQTENRRCGGVIWWEQMDNWESEIVIHGILKCCGLGREENTDICYFALGAGRFFCAWGPADRVRAGKVMRNSRKDRRRGCDRDGHLLKVNRGVRTLFPLRWQPSPRRLPCHLAYDSLDRARPTRQSVCLSVSQSPRPKTGDKRVRRGAKGRIMTNKKVWWVKGFCSWHSNIPSPRVGVWYL